MNIHQCTQNPLRFSQIGIRCLSTVQSAGEDDSNFPFLIDHCVVCMSDYKLQTMQTMISTVLNSIYIEKREDLFEGYTYRDISPPIYVQYVIPILHQPTQPPEQNSPRWLHPKAQIEHQACSS